MNDAIENLSQKENFDLSTEWQQARYHELRHSCAEVYRLPPRRTDGSMLVARRADPLGLPAYPGLPGELRSSAPDFARRAPVANPGPATPGPGGQYHYPGVQGRAVSLTPAQSAGSDLSRILRCYQSTTAAPDRCPEMREAWAKATAVRVIHRKNGGLLLRATPASRPPVGYIVFVDSDDFWSRRPSAALWLEQERTGAELVIFNLVYANDRGERWPTPDPSRSFRMKY